VSREVAAAEAAVVTVGVLHAGTKENVIPDEAIIKLNVRTFDAGVRTWVLAAIERIVNAEAAASGAPRPPEITTLDRYPLNVNDRDASKREVDAFRGFLEQIGSGKPAPRRPAKISDHLDLGGMFPRFSGSWAAPIQRLTRRRKRPTGSTNCR
jgi:metal-dependent amidase/aminoacylase/carboxypeptidase family protein